MSGVEQLAAVLREEGGLLAAALARTGTQAAPPGVAGGSDEYALVIAAVREGYLLHYADGRVVRTDDRDLALLGGDRLYALGLAQLAALGDLAAVAALADLISSCARAHAEGRPEQAAAAWEAAATALGHGS